MLTRVWPIFVLSTAFAVVYRPYISVGLRNTSRHWLGKAKIQGPNVCVKETVFDGSATTYDLAWTGDALCVQTNLQFDCCDGWTRVSGERGCPQGSFLDDAQIAADKLKAGWAVRLLTTSGLQNYIELEKDPLTVFAPLDANSRHFEYERAVRLMDASPILLSHVVRGRKLSKSFVNNQLIETLTGQKSLRINVYPNGLATANCVPIVTRDTITTGPVIHTLKQPLSQHPLFSITDVLLREVRARRFTAFLVQSRLEGLLRTTGPFTIFLPTDTAFEALGTDHAVALRYDEAAVRALVLHHIVDDVQCSVMLNDAILETNAGEKIKTRCANIEISVGGGNIIEKDVMATNGVIHMVNRVILPRRATLVNDLLKSMGFTMFAFLVERSGLLSTFSAPDSFTVLVPTNSALKSVERFNASEARNFVLNHMINGRILTTSMKSVELVNAKNNRLPFTFRFLRQGLLADSAVILTPDIEALNGVVHIVDRILVPPAEKSILQWLTDDGRFLQFLHTLRMTQPRLYWKLDAAEINEKFTVFAVADLYLSSRYSLFYSDRVTLNHIINQEILSEMVPENGRLLTITANNGRLLMVRRGVNFFAGSTYVLYKDIVCKNGVIHVVRDIINA